MLDINNETKVNIQLYLSLRLFLLNLKLSLIQSDLDVVLYRILRDLTLNKIKNNVCVKKKLKIVINLKILTIVVKEFKLKHFFKFNFEEFLIFIDFKRDTIKYNIIWLMQYISTL